MRAVKHPAKSAKHQPPKRPGQVLAERVFRLDADEVDAFVDALLPGATEEFREDLSDRIVIEQRKDEPSRPLADVIARFRRQDRAAK